MNKKIALFILIACSTDMISSMQLAQASTLDAIIHNWYKNRAQDSMTTIGKQQLQAAQNYLLDMKKDQQTIMLAWCSPDQKMIMRLLLTPPDLLHKIVDELCEQNPDMKNLFSLQPLGTLLLQFSLRRIQYKKDCIIAKHLSFPQWAIQSHDTVIALHDAVHYFSKNPDSSYKITLQQEKSIGKLPDSLKTIEYFDNKKFLPIDHSWALFASAPLTHTALLKQFEHYCCKYLARNPLLRFFFSIFINNNPNSLLGKAIYRYLKHTDQFMPHFYKTTKNLSQ